jgi:thiol-disulfide isomerase/thioredoxin
MWKPIFAAVLVALTCSADNAKPAEDKEGSPKTLKVGDPAPALKASKWLQGEAVKEFAPGKVYVVEFWATWCGWCLYFMPHAAELQAQYKDRGVTFIYYTATDPENTEAKVDAFVRKRGLKLPLRFAYADNRTTYDAWMTAAGLESMPYAFVVDRAGRIAYIGHPMFLGVVLPLVVTGNRSPQAVGDEVRKIEEEAHALGPLLPRNPAVGLKALANFEAKYPPMANNPVFVKPKLYLLPQMGRFDEAKQVAEAVIAKAVKQENAIALMQVAAILRDGHGKESKELLAVAVKAAEGAVEVAGDKNAQALIELASTYYVAGDKAKAREYARKAVAAAAGESAAVKQSIEQQARTLDGKSK